MLQFQGVKIKETVSDYKQKASFKQCIIRGSEYIVDIFLEGSVLQYINDRCVTCFLMND